MAAFDPPFSIVRRADGVVAPPQKYKLCLIDPPWRYGRGHVIGHGKAEGHYGTADWQTLAAALDVPSILEKDATVLMWATAPKLDDAMKLGHAWSLQYVTMFLNWIKTTKKDGNLRMGMGRTTRINAEHLLMFHKGRGAQGIRTKDNSAHNVAFAPIQGHSRKPAEAFDVIERVFDVRNAPSIELFARDPTREGWAAWGNEVKGLEEHLAPFVAFTSAQSVPKKTQKDGK